SSDRKLPLAMRLASLGMERTLPGCFVRAVCVAAPSLACMRPMIARAAQTRPGISAWIGVSLLGLFTACNRSGVTASGDAGADAATQVAQAASQEPGAAAP